MGGIWGKIYSYFLGLEKHRQIKKSINKLIDENNEQITYQMHILSTIKSYYEQLYTTKYPDENGRIVFIKCTDR